MSNAKEDEGGANHDDDGISSLLTFAADERGDGQEGGGNNSASTWQSIDASCIKTSSVEKAGEAEGVLKRDSFCLKYFYISFLLLLRNTGGKVY